VKSLILYDSTFGNTKIIAETVSKELGEDSSVVFVSDFKEGMLKGVGLLIVGSPIIGWKPSEKMGTFLLNLTKDRLKGIKAASFDTRVKLFIHGDATKKISNALKEKGGEIITSPRYFYVKGKEGPLLDGEIEKAKEWAKEIKRKIK